MYLVIAEDREPDPFTRSAVQLIEPFTNHLDAWHRRGELASQYDTVKVHEVAIAVPVVSRPSLPTGWQALQAASDATGWSVSGIRRWIQTGQVQSRRDDRGRIWVHAESLAACIASGQDGRLKQAHRAQRAA